MILIYIALLAFALILGAFVYAYIKLPRKYFLVVLLCVISLPLGGFKYYERNYRLSLLPDTLNVTSIAYANEESWGFGPGGNEAGIIIYPLPESVSNQISQRGMEYFVHMPPNKNRQGRRWRGECSGWSETPVKSSHDWSPNKKSGKFDIYDYICAYGFCIDIKPEVIADANAIVNSSGCFYAYGRIGLIFVCSDRKFVMYMYNG